MEYLILILCSLSVTLATYPPYGPSITRGGMPSNFIGGIQPGYSSSRTGSFQPGYRSTGYMGIYQPRFNSINNRFMSGGSSLGGGIAELVAPVYTGGMGMAPRTYTRTRITVFPPAAGTGTSSFTGGYSGYNGMPGSAPYMAGGMTGVAGINPYFTGTGGMTSIAGGSPFMAGGTPVSGSFNMGGIGGQSSMTYGSVYPYGSGMATGMNFPQIPTGNFNGFGGWNSFGGVNSGFSPMMYNKKRGAY